VGVLLVVVAVPFGGGGAAFEAAPDRKFAGGAHDVEHAHQQFVVDGLRDGPVQLGVLALEVLVTVAAAARCLGMTGSPTLLADGADPFAHPGQPSISQILMTSLDPQLQVVQLPGRMPANPAQHRADDGAPVPLTGRDLIADRIRHAPQPLTHEGSLAVPGPAPKKADAVQAHADLRVMAKADQRLLRGLATAAPAPALARLTD
jgi:hypothetical protein